jgi:hypothetical protein
MRLKNLIQAIAVTLLVAFTPTVFAQISYGVRGSTNEGKSEGVRFPIEPFKVDDSAAFREAKTITITDYTNGFMIASPDSTVPTQMGYDASGNFNTKFLTHIVNMTWVFDKPGIAFEAQSNKYTSVKAGAKISFTTNGIKMDGINDASRPIIAAGRLTQESATAKHGLFFLILFRGTIGGIAGAVVGAILGALAGKRKGGYLIGIILGIVIGVVTAIWKS